MLLICSAAAFSQVNLGSINGTVTDATGAAIPDARVTATATTTQVKYQAVTDQSGNFSVLSLPTSDYTLSVSHPGFHTYEQRGMLLTAGASVRVDVKLEVGEVTQQVTVTGAPPLLETRSGSLS